MALPQAYFLVVLYWTCVEVYSPHISCAQTMLNEVVCRFGCPLAIHSDQGRNFESGIFQELCKILEIRKTRTSPRNPKCNGQVERFNRTLIGMIKSYLRGEQTKDLTNLFPAYLMALPQAYFLVVLYWTCVEVYSPHIFHTDLSKY
jgi:transposase InsO family protein